MIRSIFAACLSLLIAGPALGMSNSSIPSKFSIPWGNSAGPSYIRAIPTTSQIGVQNCAASLTDGFPPLTFQPTSAGGCAPFGQDMNGIIKQITQWNQWQAAGGAIKYDSAFSALIGGYPSGATLQNGTRAGCFWTSVVDNNASNPDAAGAGWINSCSMAVCKSYTHDFGAVAGGADNSAALVSAINSVTASGGCLSIEPGKFYHATPVTPANFPNALASLTIIGAGKGASILYFPNAGNGLTLNLVNPANTVHMSGLAITTGATNPSSGVGLTINQSTCAGAYLKSYFSDISIRGDDNLSVDYWNTVVRISGVSGTVWDAADFIGASSLGTGFVVVGSGGCFALDNVVSKSLFAGLGIGVSYGSFTQNVSVVGSNFTGVTDCVKVPAALSGVLGRLTVSGNSFNCGGTSIGINSPVAPAVITDNTIVVQAGQIGIDFNSTTPASLRGNFISNPTLGAGTFGIVVRTAASGALIAGNYFNSLDTGVVLQNSSVNNNVQSNFYFSNTCGVNNAASCVYVNTPTGSNTIGGGTP